MNSCYAARYFVSREAAKDAKKKLYIDKQDKQDFESVFYPIYLAHRCKNKSTFAFLQTLFPSSRSSRLRVKLFSRKSAFTT